MAFILIVFNILVLGVFCQINCYRELTMISERIGASGKKKPADYLRAISSHRKSYTVIFATFGLIWAAR